LEGETTSFLYKKPFDFFAKKTGCPTVLPFIQTLRTEYYHDILQFYPQINKLNRFLEIVNSKKVEDIKPIKKISHMGLHPCK